jgi:hypothetical protein
MYFVSSCLIRRRFAIAIPLQPEERLSLPPNEDLFQLLAIRSAWKAFRIGWVFSRPTCGRLGRLFIVAWKRTLSYIYI